MEVEKRLDKLEKQLKFYRILVILVGLGAIAYVSTGATTAVPTLIKAREFEVFDKDGSRVITLGSKGDSFSIIGWDKETKLPTFGMGSSSSEGGPGFFLMSAKYPNQSKVILKIDEDKAGPILEFTNRTGNPAIRILVASSGRGYVDRK